MEILADLNEADPFDDAPIKKHIYKYHHYDGYSKKYQYEIKSLTYSVSKYTTAVMNASKIQKKKPDEELVFIFSYNNGENGAINEELYFCIYDEAVFNEYNQRHLHLPNDVQELVFDIPIDHLTKLEIYAWEVCNDTEDDGYI